MYLSLMNAPHTQCSNSSYNWWSSSEVSSLLIASIRFWAFRDKLINPTVRETRGPYKLSAKFWLKPSAINLTIRELIIEESSDSQVHCGISVYTCRINKFCNIYRYMWLITVFSKKKVDHESFPWKILFTDE